MLAPMKIISGWLVLTLLVTLSIHAADAVPAKNDAPDPKRELVWPEIRDPQALIDFAKEEIANLKQKKLRALNVLLSPDSPLAYLQPVWNEAHVYETMVFIYLDTHPQTGQGFLIIPQAKEIGNKPILFPESGLDLRIRHVIVDTDTPEIKRVLLKFAKGTGPISWLSNCVVRWRDIQNLDESRSTAPLPITMQLPEYPMDLLRQGVGGNAKIEFMVSIQGRLSDLKITASQPEFEAAVKNAAAKWQFEPGVDLETRMPVETQMALTVQFNLDD